LGNNCFELKKPVYQPKKSKAYISFDSGGRIDRYQTDGLLVVTKENEELVKEKINPNAEGQYKLGGE
jgi:hypothetical protein